MKHLIATLSIVLTVITTNAKTLIAYYSYTNNVNTIVADLQEQTGADAVRIEPAEEGLDYAANNYAIGSALIAAIRNNPDDASSYPAIKPVNVDLDDYDMVIVAAPLWWSNMAAPMQTYLFHNGAKMAGKKIGLIVSSASSGISGVESDAHRLIPEGDFVTPSLWIRSSQTSNCHTLVSNWLDQIDYTELTTGITQTVSDTVISLNVTSVMITVDGDFDSLSLYNMAGGKILESSGNPIATTALAPGVYVARINANGRSATKKIICTF